MMIFILLLWWFIVQLTSTNNISPEYFYSPCQTCGPFKNNCTDKAKWDLEFVNFVTKLIMNVCGKTEEYAVCVIQQLQKHYSKDEFIQFIEENKHEEHFIATVLDQYILLCKNE